MIQDLNKDKIKSDCFLLSISKPYSGKAVITPHNDLYDCPPPKAGFPCSPRTKLGLGLYWEKRRVQALTSSSYSAAQTGLTGF